MKILPGPATILAALSFGVIPATATTYVGSGVADGGATADGGAISSVVINNTASSITFTINSTQPMASYIFYGIEIQYVGGGASGSSSLINPWGPQTGISSGENALINTYGTGASALTYSGGTWTQNASGSFAAGGTGSTFAIMTFSLAALGLNVGNSFNFDVVSSYTNPGGQAAYSALDNPGYIPESDNSYQPWRGTNYYDSATAANSTFSTTVYTVAAPEPCVCGLLGLAGLMLLCQGSRRN